MALFSAILAVLERTIDCAFRYGAYIDLLWRQYLDLGVLLNRRDRLTNKFPVNAPCFFRVNQCVSVAFVKE